MARIAPWLSDMCHIRSTAVWSSPPRAEGPAYHPLIGWAPELEERYYYPDTDSGCGDACAWLRVQGSEFRVQGLGFRVLGSWFKVLGSGFRVHGAGFKAQGSGFTAGRGGGCGVPGKRLKRPLVPSGSSAYLPARRHHRSSIVKNYFAEI